MFVDKKKFQLYFRDQLTLSNIGDRTSRRIYRLALPLFSPETLSTSSKSRIFLYKVHLGLFVHYNMHKCIGKYCHLLEVVRALPSPFSD